MKKPYRTPHTLHGSIINECFHSGLLKGLSSVLEFLNEDIIRIRIIPSEGREETFTRRYFTRHLSPHRLLVGYTDSLRDVCVVAVYDFHTEKVYAFVYAHRTATTAQGSFTWEKP